ncbi:MAG TPA: ribosomal protein S18-alanine N-acetyltransferase [Vicinamibacterales bacterium]
MDEGRQLPPREPAEGHGILPTGWSVETLEERDLDEILAIEEASFSRPWTRQMFMWELQNAGVSYGYVLRTPEWHAAAFCTIWIVLDEIHINNVAVRPECRGGGVGRILLEFVFRLGAGLGARRATLEVRRSNASALKLYERLRFRVAGVRKNYYADPVEDALILWRDGLGWLPAGEGQEQLETRGTLW